MIKEVSLDDLLRSRPGAVIRTEGDEMQSEYGSFFGSSFVSSPYFSAQAQQTERMMEVLRQQQIAGSPPTNQPKRRDGMFQEIVSDVRSFFHQNRFVIYTVAVVFLADHFFFKGQFRDRLRATIEKMVCRCEKKIEEAIEK